MGPKKIDRCRICGNTHLAEVLDLGDQALTGVFPASRGQAVTVGPLRLLKCAGDPGQACGLVQLAHTYDLPELYGANYGYRSGLNASMVQHLRGKVDAIVRSVQLSKGDLVVDIGSNDGTTLAAYPVRADGGSDYQLVGIDPSGAKFRQFYPAHAELIPDFFSASLLRERFGERRAKVVTSFSMFYDLEDPFRFMNEVVGSLADDGIWVCEQSYLPAMLDANSYDTVCHEHLEYYALGQVKWMADRAGATIVDVSFNDVNGGSFSVTFARAASGRPEFAGLPALLAAERARGLDGVEPLVEFARRTQASREELLAYLHGARQAGRSVAGLGASTKGNVLLQYCGIDASLVRCIGEVNPDKYGAFTPGTLLPIVPQDELLAGGSDDLLVLPWHFRRFFETNPRFEGRRLVFPLPRLDFVQR